MDFNEYMANYYQLEIEKNIKGVKDFHTGNMIYISGAIVGGLFFIFLSYLVIDADIKLILPFLCICYLVFIYFVNRQIKKNKISIKVLKKRNEFLSNNDDMNEEKFKIVKAVLDIYESLPEAKHGNYKEQKENIRAFVNENKFKYETSEP